MTSQILNQALEHANRGIMIQDTNRKVVYINHACEAITKWSREEIIGIDCGAIFKCHTSTGMNLTEKCCPGLDILHRGLSHYSRELLICRGDGSECWVKASISPIKDKKGKITHIVSVLEDIGEFKRYSDEILRSKTLSTLGTFAAELAHEIKNPLNAMNVQLLVLEHEIQDAQTKNHTSTKELLETVSIVQKELKRLSGFVEDCLRFSKTGELNKKYVDINDVVRGLVSLLIPQAQLNGIQMELEVVPGLPKINADQDKVKQAILNILINSIEAMPDGGQLQVTTRLVEHEVWISCHDTGPGIPDEIKDKIFNLFYTSKDGGTGIGLSSAQNIIQAHGGTIKLEQSPTGSTFVIIIPINEEGY
ncbi:MAG: ATP-binding protein [Candidatus Brocadiaceae bacterium]|nr:ATP-binding protein [Candidatus Brocadiaceae bacterium]